MRILIKAPFGYFCFRTIEGHYDLYTITIYLPSDGDSFWSEFWDRLQTYNSHPKYSLATHNTLVASVEVTEERAELP